MQLLYQKVAYKENHIKNRGDIKEGLLVKADIYIKNKKVTRVFIGDIEISFRVYLEDEGLLDENKS